MRLFYNPLLDNSVTQFVFDPTESHHIVKVLRKREGEILHITNGKGYLFEARILSANPKKCKAEITKTSKKHRKMYWFHMAVAPTKSNERFEWFLEKATEIGVDEITPILCDRSERKIVKSERLQKVVQAAMKQSCQTYLPKINDLLPFKEFVGKARSGLQFIAHCAEGEKMELKRRAAADTDITILIGPEGDFSQTEIERAYQNGFVPVSLGENRLRTETAALVACTIVNMINNG